MLVVAVIQLVAVVAAVEAATAAQSGPAVVFVAVAVVVAEPEIALTDPEGHSASSRTRKFVGFLDSSRRRCSERPLAASNCRSAAERSSGPLSGLR